MKMMAKMAIFSFIKTLMNVNLSNCPLFGQVWLPWQGHSKSQTKLIFTVRYMNILKI
jgi:hypothetical protein